MSGYGKAYAEAYALQRLLLQDALSVNVNAATRAQSSRAYVLLERMRRDMREPRAKAQRLTRKSRARVAPRGPVAPESLSPVIAGSATPVIDSAAVSISTIVEASACTPPSNALAPAAPMPAAPAPQAPVDDPSI